MVHVIKSHASFRSGLELWTPRLTRARPVKGKQLASAAKDVRRRSRRRSLCSTHFAIPIYIIAKIWYTGCPKSLSWILAGWKCRGIPKRKVLNNFSVQPSVNEIFNNLSQPVKFMNICTTVPRRKKWLRTFRFKISRSARLDIFERWLFGHRI